MEEIDQESAPVGNVEPEITKEPEKKPELESRPNQFLMRFLRWALGFLIVFGLGALLVIVTLYVPAQRKIQQANERYAQLEEKNKADLDQAGQEIATLDRRIDSLSTFETKNQALQTDLDQTRLHVVILSARSDVAQARLALAKEDPTKAKIALSKTADTLQSLEEMLEPDQRKVVSDMQDRLTLILDEIDENAYAAESDLDVLATSLLELENAFFGAP